MCGILALARAGDSKPYSPQVVVRATAIVRHRGPDDEGYLLWSEGGSPQKFAGAETTTASRDRYRLHPLPLDTQWRVAFGHRRLSIVDLSAAGHQPMIHSATGL